MLSKKECKSEIDNLNSLSIQKRTITELTESDMASIDGGSTVFCLLVNPVAMFTLIPEW